MSIFDPGLARAAAAVEGLVYKSPLLPLCLLVWKVIRVRNSFATVPTYFLSGCCLSFQGLIDKRCFEPGLF